MTTKSVPQISALINNTYTIQCTIYLITICLTKIMQWNHIISILHIIALKFSKVYLSELNLDSYGLKNCTTKINVELWIPVSACFTIEIYDILLQCFWKWNVCLYHMKTKFPQNHMSTTKDLLKY